MLQSQRYEDRLVLVGISVADPDSFLTDPDPYPGIFSNPDPDPGKKTLFFQKVVLKGTGTRDLIWLKVISLDRSWLVGLTDDL